VNAGPSRDGDAAAGTGEVYAIYVDPSAVGTGIGQALLARAVSGMRERGYTAATLWVLDGNTRARRFYEAAGWRPDGAPQEGERGGAAQQEVRYRIALWD
jgi:GNAT superfamily N-acetyltransferase